MPMKLQLFDDILPNRTGGVRESGRAKPGRDFALSRASASDLALLDQ
jgi:hypothetical protein